MQWTVADYLGPLLPRHCASLGVHLASDQLTCQNHLLCFHSALNVSCVVNEIPLVFFQCGAKKDQGTGLRGVKLECAHTT